MYELIWNGRELIRRIHGVSSSAEYERSVIEAQRDPRYDDLRDMIVDLTDCEHYEVDDSVTDQIAARDTGASLSNPRLRIALVTRDPVFLAQLRKYRSTVVTARQVRVFDTMEAARRWLRGEAPDDKR